MNASLQFICLLLLLNRGEFICCDGIIIQNIIDSNGNRNNDGDSDVDHGGGELIFAQTFCRHGDRNICKSYPNDPWKFVEFWPGGYGALTDLGRSQHYALGQFLRRRYHRLLSWNGFESSVSIQTTDAPRILSSVETTLAGFFALEQNLTRNKSFDWQPIHVQKVYPSEYHLLATTKNCNRFDYLMLEHLNTNNTYNTLLKRFKPLISYLEANAGIKMTNILDLVILYDTLSVERLKFKQLPDWAENVMQPHGDFEEITLFWYQLHTNTSEMKRLMAGFMLKDIFDRFTQKLHSKLSPDRLLWMYFGHDLTLFNLLNSLGLYEPHFPPYASCIIFELYKIDGDPYVQIFYRNSTDTNVPALEIPNCGKFCQLQKLYDLYEDILPSQSVDVECALRENEFLPATGNPERYIIGE